MKEKRSRVSSEAHKNRNLRLGINMLIMMMCISLYACSNGNSGSDSGSIDPVAGENFYLDTICRVSIYEINGGLDEEEANAAIDRAFDRCRELDKTLSNTVEASEVSRINSAGGEWVEVGDDTLAVVNAGVEYGDLSGGAFDITIGTLTDIWDYHADDPVVPDEEIIAEAVSHVDYRNIEIDGNKIRLKDPAAKLDLGGIAKGYIGGEMIEVLRDAGVTSSIVDLGGNIVALGNKPDGTGFVIGIEQPYSDRTELIGTTEASDESVVTSGVYERQFEVNGKIYHHILDPQTGYPAKTDLQSVTVKASTGRAMDLDALSTILLIKGVDDGMAIVESMDGIEAVFCSSGDEITTSSGMKFETN